MNKRVLAIIIVIIIIVIAFAVLVVMPMETKAPTTQQAQNSTATTSGTAPGHEVVTGTTDEPVAAEIPDLIVVTQPYPHNKVASPLTISGQARGNWFFEASAPIELKDASGVVIGHGVLKAQGNWMTTSFVPFTATLTFTSPATHSGTIILKNDNPSGDPKKQKELDIPVEF